MNPPVATPQSLVAPVSRPRGLGLAAVALGIMLLPLNSTMIGIALPRIARSLNVDASLSAWLITAAFRSMYSRLVMVR